MSHIVKSKIEVSNKPCLLAAVEALGLENLGEGTHTLYGGQKAKGIAVKLPDWSYPAVINVENGEVKYDNYGGSWGKQIELDKLMQEYTLKVGEEQAEQAGMLASRNLLDNGDIELECTLLATH